MKTPWRWWRERQATDKTCKHLALMTEDITNITDRLVAFVWEDIEKIIDQMSEDLFRPIESIKPIKKNVMKDLLSCEGRRFRCKIDGTLATGIIRVVDKCVYLCQNEKNGFHSIDKKGYKYAWCVYSGTEADFARPNVRVTDFRVIPITAEEIEAYKDWQVGDRLRKKDGSSRTIDVIFRFGELIVGKFIDTRRALTNYTCDELYEDGFRLIVDPAPEEEIVEVTMDEIAKLKGVPVERLRVKKEDK